MDVGVGGTDRSALGWVQFGTWSISSPRDGSSLGLPPGEPTCPSSSILIDGGADLIDGGAD
jgi:hypothetical protein